MDPNATLQDFLQAVEDGSYHGAYAAWESLSDWTDRGGFPPEQWSRNTPAQTQEKLRNMRNIAHSLWKEQHSDSV